MTAKTLSEQTLGVTNPYVGPRAFRHGEPLYGRDLESEELLDVLLAERLVILQAPSGAGKTSLLQASIFGRLKQDGFTVLPIARVNLRPDPKIKTEKSFNPYLYSAALDLSRSPQETTAENVTEHEPAALGVAYKGGLDQFLVQVAAVPADTLQVLIFDQFEELLTLDGNDVEMKHAFCREVGRVLRARSRFAVFSIRDDFVGALEPYVGHFGTRLAARYRLDFLSLDAAKIAIRRPVEPNVTYVPEALTRLVEDLARVRVQVPGGKTEERAGVYVEPVYLQVVCARMWDALGGKRSVTVKDVEKYGNVDRALRGYYDEGVAQAAQEGQSKEADIRYWIENQLIVNRLRAQALVGAEQERGVSPASVEYLLRCGILRKDQRRGAFWYELAHDRLVLPVLAANNEWQPVQGDWLETKAMRWREAGKDSAYLLKLRKLSKVHRSLRAMSPAQRVRIDDYLRSSRNEWFIKLGTLILPLVALLVVFIVNLMTESAATRAANRGQAEALDSVGQLLAINTKQRDSLRQLIDSLTSVRSRYIYQQAWGLDSTSSAQTVRQSIQANQALQSLVRTSRRVSPDVRVHYHEKSRDKQRIEFALRELGYRVEVLDPLAGADRPTNTVAYGPSVPLRDLKLIALTLVRGGTELRSICPFRSVGDRAFVAEINYSARASAQPPIELEAINALSGDRPEINCPAALSLQYDRYK